MPLGGDVWLWEAVADQNRGRGRDDHVGRIVGELDATGPANNAPARTVPQIRNRNGGNTPGGSGGFQSRLRPKLALEMCRRSRLFEFARPGT